jgi:hypothetical protein
MTALRNTVRRSATIEGNRIPQPSPNCASRTVPITVTRDFRDGHTSRPLERS